MNWIIFSSIFILLILAIIFGPNAWRLYKVANLFDKKTISYNFINMKEFFPTSTPIKASTSPYVFKRREGFTLPEFYEFEGKEEQIQAAIDYFNTDGLMILKMVRFYMKIIGMKIKKTVDILFGLFPNLFCPLW